MPAVSVVVATHEQGAWLDEAIAGVRAQTFADWDLVVVDDGSTDGTRAIAERHQREDPRVRYLWQARSERSAARNRGIAESAGPLVAFLDADDRWLPEKLARQVAALARDPGAGLCYTPARFIGPAGERLAIRKPLRAITGDVFARLVRGNVLILASVIVRRSCLDAVGGFDPALAALGCEDWDLWLRIARRWQVTVVDEELTLYRRHAANTGWERVLDGALMVIDHCYDDPETMRRAGVSRRSVRALHFWTNAAALLTTDRAAAARLAARALRESPATALGRAGLGTIAGLALPGPVVRFLQGVRC